MKQTTEYDLGRCPECDSTRLVTEHQPVVEPYGIEPHSVQLMYVRPQRRCLACKLVFTDEAGKAAQTAALEQYRVALTLHPKLKYDAASDMAYITLTNIAKGAVRATVIGCASPRINLDLDRDGRLVGIEVFDALRTLPKSCLDAGEGIEPPTTGV